MNLTQLQRIDRDSDDYQTERRKTAYHEAGHASMNWMFGNHSDLEFIDMQGSADGNAFVWSRGADATRFLRSCRDETGYSRWSSKREAQKSVMYFLAGHAAENRIDENDFDSIGDFSWFDACLFENELMPSELSDISRAVSVSQALYGDNGNARKFLSRMASWSDEAMEHPHLWAAIEALAERLQKVKKRISGETAIRIMSKAWKGKSCGLPYLEMGRAWRRRFCRPKIEEN